MALCSAITHSGARCSSPAAPESGDVCAHHARMARLMALAPKAATNAAPAPSVSSLSSTTSSSPAHHGLSPSQQQPTSAAPMMRESPLELSVVQKSLAAVAGASASRPSSQASLPAAPVASGAPPSPSSPSTTTSNTLAMLPSEGVLAAVSCSFQFPSAVDRPALPGTLFITNYRVRFEPTTAALRSPGHYHRLLDDALVGIPRACVSKLSYPQAASATRSKYDSAVPTQLVLKFKDLRVWTLGGDIATLMTTLNRHVFVDSALSLFAFAASVPSASLERQHHQLYSLHVDFARMGVDLSASAFRVTNVNRAYTMCPTYPPELVVPASVTDHEIASVAEFRSKGRLPICSFVHARNSASIWRCAQPKRGILNAQSSADDRYLASLAYSNRQQARVWIADCRPELNARVNKLTGGGTESSNHQHARVSFLNIANIHAMRESIESVRSLVATGNTDLDMSWSARVEETKWLSHVRRVLSAALQVADAVENKATTVLVHCSDGWDRTGQLCALAQLLLDAHYRSISGFVEIIEKEWIRVGHKFHDRIGPGRSEHDEQSPVFLQFLDCVWQLLRLYPTYFEFNGALLECIADATYSGRYGTFLGNCDRERVAWNVATRTPSLWTYVLAHKAQFTNPFYRPATSAAERVLLPPASTVLRQVTLWTEYYFRSSTLPANALGNPSPPRFGAGTAATAKTPQQDLESAMAAALRRIQVLEDELRDARAASAAPVLSPAPAHLPEPYQQPPLYEPRAPAVVSLPPAAPFAAALTVSPVASAAAAPLSNSSSSSSHQSPSRRASPPTSSSSQTLWTCAICTKANAPEASKCVVCGRPQPSAS